MLLSRMPMIQQRDGMQQQIVLCQEQLEAAQARVTNKQRMERELKGHRGPRHQGGGLQCADDPGRLGQGHPGEPHLDLIPGDGDAVHLGAGADGAVQQEEHVHPVHQRLLLLVPTKGTMNLYYKPDRTTKPATIALYVLFALTVLLGLSKVLVYDLWVQVRLLSGRCPPGCCSGR